MSNRQTQSPPTGNEIGQQINERRQDAENEDLDDVLEAMDPNVQQQQHHVPVQRGRATGRARIGFEHHSGRIFRGRSFQGSGQSSVVQPGVRLQDMVHTRASGQAIPLAPSVGRINTPHTSESGSFDTSGRPGTTTMPVQDSDPVATSTAVRSMNRAGTSDTPRVQGQERSRPMHQLQDNPIRGILMAIRAQAGIMWGEFPPNSNVERLTNGPLLFVRDPIPRSIPHIEELRWERQILNLAFYPDRSWDGYRRWFNDRSAAVKYTLNDIKNDLRSLERFRDHLRAELHDLMRLVKAMQMYFGPEIGKNVLANPLKEKVYLAFPNILTGYVFGTTTQDIDHPYWKSRECRDRLSDYLYWIAHYSDFLQYILTAIGILIIAVRAGL